MLRHSAAGGRQNSSAGAHAAHVAGLHEGAAPFRAGSPADAFHVVEPMTHAAAIAKLRDTEGYGLIAAGEGGPVLCPAWPSNGTWTQNTHINQRLLNAAQGGSVSWETVFDRKDRKAAAVEDGKPPCESTNMTIALFQQLSVFRNWSLVCRLKGVVYQSVW